MYYMVTIECKPPFTKTRRRNYQRILLLCGLPQNYSLKDL